MASQVVCIELLSSASFDLSPSDLVRYRCYKGKPVGAHPVHLQTCVLLFSCIQCMVIGMLMTVESCVESFVESCVECPFR